MSKKGKEKELKQLRSCQLFSPIRDIKDGIIYTKDGRFVKILEFSAINYPLLSADDQAIIDNSFEKAIMVMPDSAQFKIVSTKADPTKFIQKIAERMQTEEDEGCLKLMEEQAHLIAESSFESIKRRFFVVFEYEEPAGINRTPSFKKVKQEMDRTAFTIIQAMAECGNTLLSNDSDEYILSTLYEMFSRAKSEQISFEDNKMGVIARYASADIDKKDEESIHIPINDLICPDKIDLTLSPKYMVVDGMYYMFCYLPKDTYPVRAIGGWLSVLVNIGEGIDIDFFYHKEPLEKTKTKLRYKLRANKIKARDTDDTSAGYEDLEAAVDSGYYIKNALGSGENFYYISTLITIRANSLEELDYKYKYVKDHCIRNDLKLKQCLFQQEEAFIQALPLVKTDKNIWNKSKRNILSSALASCYPFVSFELIDENGIPLGEASNHSLVFIDNLNTRMFENGNMAILGSSGAGKTYSLQVQALRYRERGDTQVFIIAPLKGFEFERACKQIGGTYIKIAPGSGYNINIMEIRKKDELSEAVREIYGGDNKESILMAKIQQLHSFFSILMKNIYDEEKQVLDEALINTYERFGITANNSSLIDPSDPSKYKKMPILGDLYNTLREKGEPARRMANILKRYVDGSAKSFNQQTNVNLNNKYIVLDVSTLTEELLPVGMFIALDMVWDEARKNRTQRKIIYVDECWRLIGPDSSPEAAHFVLEIFKIIRGYGGAAVAATQNLNDFFALDNGRYGKGILNNAEIKMLMKAKEDDAETIAEKINLTQREFDSIKTFHKGQCLLIANNNRLTMEIKATKTEDRLINTNREKLTEQLEELQG